MYSRSNRLRVHGNAVNYKRVFLRVCSLKTIFADQKCLCVHKGIVITGLRYKTNYVAVSTSNNIWSKKTMILLSVPILSSKIHFLCLRVRNFYRKRVLGDIIS